MAFARSDDARQRVEDLAGRVDTLPAVGQGRLDLGAAAHEAHVESFFRGEDAGGTPLLKPPEGLLHKGPRDAVSPSVRIHRNEVHVADGWLSVEQPPLEEAHDGTVFLGCELALEPGDPQALKERGAKLKKAKADSQPLALPSAGCVFKNPPKELPAGRLIDELGLKGTRIGGAEISRVHGNFIVNPERDAQAADVVRLVRRIRRTAFRERGVVLEMEIEAWACPDELRAHPAELSDD